MSRSNHIAHFYFDGKDDNRVNFQISILRTSHSSFKVGIFVTIVGAGSGFASTLGFLILTFVHSSLKLFGVLGFYLS